MLVIPARGHQRWVNHELRFQANMGESPYSQKKTLERKTLLLIFFLIAPRENSRLRPITLKTH